MGRRCIRVMGAHHYGILATGQKLNALTKELETLLERTTEQSRRLALLLTLAKELQELAPDRGLERGREALELARSLGDVRSIAEAEYLIGHNLRILGRAEEAIPILESSVQGFASTGDRSQQGYALYQLGAACMMVYALESAMRHVEQARAIFEELGDRYGCAKTLQGGSVAMHRTKRLDEAVKLTREAVAIYRELPDRDLDLGYALFNLASQMADQGLAADTLPYLLEAVGIGRQTDKSRLLLYALTQLGVAHTARREFEAAHSALRESLERGKSLGDMQALAWGYLHRGELELEEGKIGEAEASFHLALEIGKPHHLDDNAAKCHDGLWKVYSKQRQYPLALEHFQQFHSITVRLTEEAHNRNFLFMQTQLELDLAKKEKQILEVSKAELEQRVSERTQELSTAVADLEHEVQERRKAEERARFLAERDPLTGCANRSVLFRHLTATIAQAEGNPVGVLFVDLDRFKQINDSLGHYVGDRVLIEASKRLQQCGGNLVLSRYGGDEFVFVLDAPQEIARIEDLVSRLQLAFQTPFHAGRESVQLSLSLGVAIYPEHGTDAETLVRHADLAMYSVKQTGRNSYALFDPAILEASAERNMLARHLQHALERKEFRLHYQAKASVREDRIIGAEALLRWIHPELGVISPDRFIPIAEETGLIVEIGRWVFREAARQLREWIDQGITGYHVAVNLSVRQLREQSLIQELKEAIADYGIPPEGLEVEITESMLMGHADQARTRLRELRDAGILVALDDFGTGYSNLSYLEQLPITTIKIDRSFIRGIANNGRDLAIVKAVIAMAHSLGIEVTAEGVEDQAQLHSIRAAGCDLYQGYLLSHPVPAAEAANLLATRR